MERWEAEHLARWLARLPDEEQERAGALIRKFVKHYPAITTTQNWPEILRMAEAANA